MFIQEQAPAYQKPLIGALIDSAKAYGIESAWLLNEGAGAAAFDSSGRGRMGTLSGGIAWTVGGLLFNGTGQRVVTYDPAIGAGDFTWECRFRLDGTGGGAYCLISTYNHPVNGNGCEFYILSNRLTAYMGGVVGGTTPVLAGERHHACITRANGAVTLYLDGRVEGSGSLPATATGSLLTLGNNCGYDTERFIGLLEHVRCYRRALSAAEVALLAREPHAMFVPIPRHRALRVISLPLITTQTSMSADAIAEGTASDGIALSGSKA